MALAYGPEAAESAAAARLAEARAHAEAADLLSGLEALQGWTHRIFVVDSGSTDRTREIVESTGATFVHHDWSGYAAQKNWALNNLPFEADWTLIIDADEVVTPALRAEIEAVLLLSTKKSRQ